ncbi:DNA mismatch repair protein MutS [Mucilaginibacter sp. ZT4R22]|uniref:DNA mismatch repair protein MutS n=1 Tax=Mucilaginibacter pankratovii TaxID=2772110 RepID=A0ABR7WX73_9SPHI|nr:DNA mismatch repair protein MutS [Mucilaginibacter pankratovii]MBD1366885.1 DNA mismatch repair protein MutS [Mucilaginibacter pankratovii]
MEQDILTQHTQAAAQAQQQADGFAKQANTYSLYRLGIFALFIASIVLTVSEDNILILVAAVLALGFVFAKLVGKQNEFEAAKNFYLDLKKVNENEAASMAAHSNIYHDGGWFTDDKHHYTADLDIFGKSSLFQLINRCATLNGNIKLAGWLLAPATKEVVLSRQEAVKELAAKPGWKLNFQANLLFSLKQHREQVTNLITFLKTPVELDNEKFLRVYSQSAPFVLLALLVAGYFYTPVLYVVVPVMWFNYRQASTRSKIVGKTDLIAGKIDTALKHFVLAFQNIEQEEWATAYTQNSSKKLKDANGHVVSDKIKQLSILINKLNYRLNMILMVLLNAIFIWDIRQLMAIEAWKKANHENFETAFDVIAEFEALISITVPAINYPDWTYPLIADTEGYTLTAKNIAHPLIRGKRVDNDYELNNAFSIDIITGSNMAGKSTFLRTIGINTVLALAGAPVCAAAMQVSVITMVSYMRIKDSLNESTSTFKAELDRLQMLLAAVENESRVFFLIDEMLRGTNSVDKYLGSKAVIEQLIAKKGVGMVATHDLQIARLEDKYPAYIRNYYFDIQVIGGEMLFDYKIKHGECKTFNASLLLKQIGINVGEE